MTRAKVTLTLEVILPESRKRFQLLEKVINFPIPPVPGLVVAVEPDGLYNPPKVDEVTFVEPTFNVEVDLTSVPFDALEDMTEAIQVLTERYGWRKLSTTVLTCRP
jgi:hypothetical protein